MIILGRSPTIRNVSRDHRVDFEWLCDRKNLDPGIPIKNVNTNKQIADVLTEGSFSCERWFEVTQFVNFMTHHMRSCSHLAVLLLSVYCDDHMSRRDAVPIQESATTEQRPMRNLAVFSRRENDKKTKGVIRQIRRV